MKHKEKKVKNQEAKTKAQEVFEKKIENDTRRHTKILKPIKTTIKTHFFKDGKYFEKLLGANLGNDETYKH